MKLFTLLSFIALPLSASEQSPYFQIHGSHTTDTFPLKSSHAEVTITGPIAKVTLTQTYTNLGDQPIDATYLFPASTKAAVHGMTMTIGERTLKAEIHKKEEARRKFEKAKKEHKSASLLEQERPNIFSMEVARILPGDELRLALHYSEILIPRDNEYEFVIPTAIGPRYSAGAPIEKTTTNPFLNEGEKTATRFSTTVTLKSPLPIKSLACSSHKTAQLEFQSKTDATLTLPPSQPDRDFIVRYRLAGTEIQTGLIAHQGADENTFLLQLEPPTRVTPKHIPPRDFIFVVDVSGSMTGFPLNLAKNLFRELTDTLRPTDSFNVVLFAGANEVLSQTPLPAKPANIRRAIKFLNNQRGGGGTELRRALSTSLDLSYDRDTARSLVLITDGYIRAESDVFDLIRDKGTGTNIFPLGVGSSVNRHLIKGLCHLAGRDEMIVTHSSETEKAKARFLDAIASPVLTNIRLEGEGIALADLQPARQPDLFAGRPLSLAGKWTGNASGTIILKGTQGDGSTLTRRFELGGNSNNPVLPVLWAREKVRGLADYASLTKRSSLVDAVTELGLKYQLLTPFTSFVAVSEEPRKDTTPTKSVVQAQPLPKGVKNSAKSSPSNGSVPEPSTSLLLIFLTAFLTTLRIRRQVA